MVAHSQGDTGGHVTGISAEIIDGWLTAIPLQPDGAAVAVDVLHGSTAGLPPQQSIN